MHESPRDTDCLGGSRRFPSFGIRAGRCSPVAPVSAQELLQHRPSRRIVVAEPLGGGFTLGARRGPQQPLCNACRSGPNELAGARGHRSLGRARGALRGRRRPARRLASSRLSGRRLLATRFLSGCLLRRLLSRSLLLSRLFRGLLRSLPGGLPCAFAGALSGTLPGRRLSRGLLACRHDAIGLPVHGTAGSSPLSVADQRSPDRARSVPRWLLNSARIATTSSRSTWMDVATSKIALSSRVEIV